MSKEAKEYNVDDLKRRLKAKRKEKGYKQEYVATKSCLSVNTVRNAENPNVKTISDTDTIIRLCNFYGCSMDYIYGRSDYTDPHKEYIGKTLGIEQKTIEKISALPDILKPLLEVIINDTDLLSIISDYLLVDVSKDGLPIRCEQRITQGKVKDIVIERPYVRFPDGTSDETIGLYNDLMKTTILDRIRDELNRIKPNI